MNFINPIPNAEFQIGIVCALMCIMFIFLYVGVKLINRIEELRADMVQEDEAVAKSFAVVVQERKTELKRVFDGFHDRLVKVESTIYKPLYEVGNTIWFNRGNDGEAGVFEDHKGIIKSIIAVPGELPTYQVKVNEHAFEVLVHQSLITAWTN